MTARKMKVKVTKKKLKTKKILIILLVFLALIASVNYLLKLPIKNIYITGNSFVPDKEILSLTKLDKYPSFFKTYFIDYKQPLKKNKYIQNVKITRKLFGKLYLHFEEKQPLFIYNNKIVLSTGEQTENKYNIDYIPYIKNNVDDILKELVIAYQKINNDVTYKISEIEYVPNEIDKKRFLLTMIDANYVYITLPKIEKLNKYNSIVSELQNKKGIIYLDSGDYIEIKDWHK